MNVLVYGTQFGVNKTRKSVANNTNETLNISIPRIDCDVFGYSEKYIPFIDQINILLLKIKDFSPMGNYFILFLPRNQFFWMYQPLRSVEKNCGMGSTDLPQLTPTESSKLLRDFPIVYC